MQQLSLINTMACALFGGLLAALFAGSGPKASAAAPAPSPAAAQARLLLAADALLETGAVSYVYGGSKLGSAAECESCNRCLDEAAPEPKQRLAACPECRACSLDCSHFTALLHRLAGIPHPYLPTALMRSLDAVTLRKNYRLLDLGVDVQRVQAGDLVVYRGHVVMVERIHSPGVGDIVHATGGRDVRGPGQGIQRERRVRLASYRGPAQRVLRHVGLVAASATQRSLRRIPPKKGHSGIKPD